MGLDPSVLTATTALVMVVQPYGLTDARSLLLAITMNDFISALVVTNACLKYLQDLTSNLQAETKDIIHAVGEIKRVISMLQNVRDNIDTHHSCCFSTVEKMCGDVVIKFIDAIFLPALHLSTTAIHYPSLWPIIYYLRCSHASAPITLLGLSIVPSIIVVYHPVLLLLSDMLLVCIQT